MSEMEARTSSKWGWWQAPSQTGEIRHNKIGAVSCILSTHGWNAPHENGGGDMRLCQLGFEVGWVVSKWGQWHAPAAKGCMSQPVCVGPLAVSKWVWWKQAP
eukprot:1147342-Pelagomonas_calceolata.AAC.6